MKILFLDDSYRKGKGYLGYGGYCLDGESVKPLASNLAELKRGYKIPKDVEIKWSPPKSHFLNTKFRGVRYDLYRDMLQLLGKHGARAICAVHSLNECYGKQLYNWKSEELLIWAAKEQFKFLAERFESIYLEGSSDCGIIISDEYGQRDKEDSLIQGFSSDMLFGTVYHRFQRICMIPLMSDSKYLPDLQFADVIIDIVVASLSESKYGLELFEDVAKLFITNPHKGSLSFGSVFSSAVMGYGLKLFPAEFKREKEKALFEDLNEKYLVTNEGLTPRS